MTTPAPQEGPNECEQAPLPLMLQQTFVARSERTGNYDHTGSARIHTSDAKVYYLSMRSVPALDEKANSGSDRPAGSRPARAAGQDASPHSETNSGRPQAEVFNSGNSGRLIDGGFAAAGELAGRALRLTLDGILILIFSPVIAIWLLVERRHRNNGD